MEGANDGPRARKLFSFQQGWTKNPDSHLDNAHSRQRPDVDVPMLTRSADNSKDGICPASGRRGRPPGPWHRGHGMSIGVSKMQLPLRCMSAVVVLALIPVSHAHRICYSCYFNRWYSSFFVGPYNTHENLNDRAVCGTTKTCDLAYFLLFLKFWLIFIFIFNAKRYIRILADPVNFIRACCNGIPHTHKIILE